MNPTVLAGDFGGTNLRAALVDDTGAVLVRHEVSTPATATPEAVLEAITALFTDVRSRAPRPPPRLASPPPASSTPNAAR